MKPPRVRGQKRLLTLKKKVGQGGEATVWATADGRVAKIYLSKAELRRAKVDAMLRRPLPKTTPPIAAWPEEQVCYADSGAFCGFVMPIVPDAEPLSEFLNPSARRRVEQKIGRSFGPRDLVVIASNLARVVEVVHAQSYVIGDINESNFLVNHVGHVCLIDADSIQVREPNGTIHRCLVGTPRFTAPELQALAYGAVDRSAEHDRFGLAVLAFMLLMRGQHPFRAIDRSSNAPRSDQENIDAGIYPYEGRFAGFDAPVHAPPIECLGSEVRRAFETTFVEGYRNPARRVTATEWVQILDRLAAKLVVCSNDETHAFHQELGSCPACARAARTTPAFQQRTLAPAAAPTPAAIPSPAALSSVTSSWSVTSPNPTWPTVPFAQPLRPTFGTLAAEHWRAAVGVLAAVLSVVAWWQLAGLLGLASLGCAAIATAWSSDSHWPARWMAGLASLSNVLLFGALGVGAVVDWWTSRSADTPALVDAPLSASPPELASPRGSQPTHVVGSDSECGAFERAPAGVTGWSSYLCRSRAEVGFGWDECLRWDRYATNVAGGCPGATRCCPAGLFAGVVTSPAELCVEDDRPPLHVHRDASSGSPTVATLDNGSRVTATDTAQEWTRIETPVAGWVWTPWLARCEGQAQPAELPLDRPTSTDSGELVLRVARGFVEAGQAEDALRALGEATRAGAPPNEVDAVRHDLERLGANVVGFRIVQGDCARARSLFRRLDAEGLGAAAREQFTSWCPVEVVP